MKPFRKQNNFKQVNNFITFRTLRVIGEEGQLGVMSKSEALDRASISKLDLVVINEKSDPPIAKIVNANKFYYEQKKKEKLAAKKQRENQIVVKEMQFRLGIDQHDFDTKCKNIIKFINKGNKVKCVIRYKGRENSNKTVGFTIMDRIIETIDSAQWETKPTINGNRMIGILMRKE